MVLEERRRREGQALVVERASEEGRRTRRRSTFRSYWDGRLEALHPVSDLSASSWSSSLIPGSLRIVGPSRLPFPPPSSISLRLLHATNSQTQPLCLHTPTELPRLTLSRLSLRHLLQPPLLPVLQQHRRRTRSSRPQLHLPTFQLSESRNSRSIQGRCK